MENVEELLLVPGITPELLYGRYSRMPNGSLINLGGLSDFLSPQLQESSGLDPFSVHPSLLVALGMDPAAARNFADLRRNTFNPLPFLARMNNLGSMARVGFRLDLGDIFQVRATARVRLPNGTLSQTRRTVALLIKYVAPNPRYFWISPWTHLRWYDRRLRGIENGIDDEAPLRLFVIPPAQYARKTFRRRGAGLFLPRLWGCTRFTRFAGTPKIFCARTWPSRSSSRASKLLRFIVCKR